MENYKFQANINELLNIVINNIYSNKDIFIRELISNSSDAINKKKDDNAFIKIILDKTNKIIKIYDNGVGLNKEDIIHNIGTIAQSDTKNYTNMIGCFGIGFYSSFLVSKKVIIITKKDMNKYFIWESDSKEEYSILESDEYHNELIKLDRGTIIECYLKDDCLEYLNEDKIIEIIKKHSQFIKYPIYVNDIHINKYKTIWNSSSMLKEDIIIFYKYFFHKKNIELIDNPLGYKIFYGEGKINFKGILYIPYENIVNMFETTKQNNIKLYVKNVLITENSSEICPEWLSFLVGVIDIDDISLNISRETLQQNDRILLLRQQFIKKSIDFFKELMVYNFELYKIIYEKYGKFLKVGVRDEEDNDNKNKLKELLLFKSLQTGIDKMITLKQYIDTLKESQKTIYYIINEDYNNIINSPYLEKFINKKYNVLFMIEPVDEYLMEIFTEYNNYKFCCIGKGVIYLNDTEEELEVYNKKSEEYRDFCEYIKDQYKGQLLTVKISLYLYTSPCIIYSAEYGISANMEKILKAQTMLTHTTEMKNMMHYKNLELNPHHPIIIKLKHLYDNKKDFDDILDMLYTTSLLHSGYNIQSNQKYISNIYKLIENV